MNKQELIKRAIYYVTILYGVLAICWLATLILPALFTGMWAFFSVLPVLATILTRVLTKDKSPWHLRPNFCKHWRTYLFSMFGPGLAIFLGGLLYFTIFPNELDLTGRNLVALFGQYGAPENLLLAPRTIFMIGIGFIFISPLVLPVHLFALGEEIGWRGYFLPILLKLTSPRKATIIHGLLWGLAHAPLIYFGFNYGLDYWGAPWSGILMMTLVCIVLGTWLAFLTIRTESIIPAVILHGSSNVIGELPALVAFLGISPLLGPNPTGLIGMIGLLIGAAILFWQLNIKKEI
jgi:membrane protease YdiL (CAAX protease family)